MGKPWRRLKGIVNMKKCRYCNSTKNLTVDHKIPKIQGGTDEIKNLQCLCKKCNGTKSDLSDRQVRMLFRWFLTTKFYTKSLIK